MKCMKYEVRNYYRGTVTRKLTVGFFEFFFFLNLFSSKKLRAVQKYTPKTERKIIFKNISNSKSSEDGKMSRSCNKLHNLITP